MSRTRAGLYGLAAVALVWRVVVLANPGASPLLGDEPTRGDLNLLVARSLMGLVYLACGALILVKTRNRRSALFALSAICAAIHWGGPVAIGDNQLQLAIWLVYFTVSVMLTESAFLHFTLVFPEPWSWGPRHATRFVSYLPVVLGMVAAFMVLATAPDPVSDGWQGKFFILETLQSNLFALAGLVVLAIRCFRARPADGPRSITGPMAVAAWAAVLPWTAVMSLASRAVAVPRGSDVYTLFFVITPLVFTWAILRYEPVSELEDAEVER